ncbi:unnamed protein product [Ilex paraguariensis]|uniref:X8 domain-containing protein n=1 Tax=Ilex paraguariensis TaxID=185542 RepID=A0ABC8RBY1_9AQUA
MAKANITDSVGVNWGRQTTQKLLPSMVVDMLLTNGIGKVKLFSAQSIALDAFAGTNIQVTIAVPNNDLQIMKDKDNATNWVRTSITQNWNDFKFKYVVVGNEPFSLDEKDDTYRKDVLPAFQLIQGALDEAGFGDKIKVTVPHFLDVLKLGSTKPSEAGHFRDEVKDAMIQMLEHLNASGAPFMATINPIYLLQKYNYSLEFAFFDGEDPNSTITDGDITYTNMFDAAYDAFVWSLKNAGFPNMKIVIGQIGWPTDGDPNCNIANAKRFYDGFLKKMASDQGTPLRPGPLEAYFYNLVDENRIDTSRGMFQRHWGIYNYDGTPKFQLDFSGKGHAMALYPAKGVVYLPKRWCVFTNDFSDLAKVNRNFEFACNQSDCSSLVYGGSCNNLDYEGNISYAFNMFFQTRSQKANDAACKFEDISRIVTTDPSQGECKFPVEVLSSIADKTSEASELTINVELLVIFYAIFGIILMN